MTDKKVFPLSLARRGDKLKIVRFKGGKNFKKKIDDMGLVKGSIIEIKQGGFKEPFIVEKNKNLIAVGYGMTGKILVEKL